MSGIVGGAGSKSGVIGTTELDYEKGTWTPVFKGNNTGSVIAHTISHATYVKIGKFVTCQFFVVRADASGGSDVVTWTGVPFASEGTGYHASVGTAWCGASEEALVLQDNYANNVYNFVETGGVYHSYTQHANGGNIGATFTIIIE